MLTLLSNLPPEIQLQIMLITLTPPTEWSGFDFQGLALGFAAISFGLIGFLMSGAAFFGEQAEQAKRTWLPTTIQGLILVTVASFIIGILAPT